MSHRHDGRTPRTGRHRLGHPEHGQVVGLGPAAGEHQVARAAAEGIGEHVTGVVEGASGGPGKVVGA